MSRELYMALCPGSKLPRPQQYDLAWKALTSTTLSDAWNAKCWLTYRACDGDITIEHWRQHISPNNPSQAEGVIGYRWQVSQLCAEIYLHTLYGHPVELDACHQALDALQPHVSSWPYAGLGFLRTDVLRIFRMHAAGEPINAIADMALRKWQESVNFTSLDIPRRFFEMKDDLEALRALAKIRHPQKSTLPAAAINPKTVFAKCLRKIGDTARVPGNAIWSNCPEEPEKRVALGVMVPAGGTFIELGVAKAKFAEELLRSHPQIKYIGIDKWNDKRHPAAEQNQAAERLAVFGDRARIIKSTFAGAVAKVPPADLVYIDGYAHTGQDGGRTLDDWLPKVKPGGVIAGHDYDPVTWPDTFKAVNEFAAKHGLTITTISGDQHASWWAKVLH